jgi:hypothetical protein
MTLQELLIAAGRESEVDAFRKYLNPGGGTANSGDFMNNSFGNGTQNINSYM